MDLHWHTTVGDDQDNKCELMDPRLLIAGDRSEGIVSFRSDLESEGYRVDLAKGGDEALLLAGLHPYEAIILDVTTPSLDDLEMVQRLRRGRITAPVLVLAAGGAVEDRVRRLDAGADDYLPKPFSMSELLARLRALLRRKRSQSTTLLQVADLELDRVTRQARRGGKRIELTRREFALLELLMSTSPQRVSKATIIEQVWHNDLDPRSNVVNVYINRIRRKIHRQSLPSLLHTVRGVGFCCRELF